MMRNKNYVNLDVNPCKMCMPMGASIAFKGIESAVAMIHGSQGCSTYIRRHIATHYNEPIDIASSALNEKQTIYGGSGSLKKGLKNVIQIYKPKFIGICTSCLAETIGEDIKGIVTEFSKEEKTDDVTFITASTPGYGSSQYEGYYFTLRRIVEELTHKSPKNETLNIIVGNISPADIRSIKEILERMEIQYTLLPDISHTLDSEYKKGAYKKIHNEGTKLEDIKKMSGAVATIEMSTILSEENSPGKYLEDTFGVPLYKCPIPIGLENNDRFIGLLNQFSKLEIPKKILEARGRMLDGMIDSHKYNGEGRAAIFGDPEMVYSLTKLCIENGIVPKVVATGTKASKLKQMLHEDIQKIQEEILILDDTDFEKIKELSVNEGVNILIGNSDGAFITEKEGIPLVRIGFPIHDQIGGQRKVSVGYDGSMLFLDQITNTLLDEKHGQYRTKMYELYYLRNEAVL